MSPCQRTPGCHPQLQPRDTAFQELNLSHKLLSLWTLVLTEAVLDPQGSRAPQAQESALTWVLHGKPSWNTGWNDTAGLTRASVLGLGPVWSSLAHCWCLPACEHLWALELSMGCGTSVESACCRPQTQLLIRQEHLASWHQRNTGESHSLIRDRVQPSVTVVSALSISVDRLW